MNESHISSHADLFFALREQLGPIYGSEDLCILLYALARREKPKVVVELGTGLGVTTSWIAAAMKENGFGTIYTFDNGSHFKRERIQNVTSSLSKPLSVITEGLESITYDEFLTRLFSVGEVETHVAFTEADIEKETVLSRLDDENIDWLFSDYSHGPGIVEKIVSAFLPYMSETSSIFLDSASTHIPSFLILERIIACLQDLKVPLTLRNFMTADELTSVLSLVGKSEITLRHLTEKRHRDQNSTAWIRFEPADVRPAGTEHFH